jgi:hypothetical protein
MLTLELNGSMVLVKVPSMTRKVDGLTSRTRFLILPSKMDLKLEEHQESMRNSSKRLSLWMMDRLKFRRRYGAFLIK